MNVTDVRLSPNDNFPRGCHRTATHAHAAGAVSLGRSAMKKMLVLLVMGFAVMVLAQDKFNLTVKDSSTTTGVVIVSGQIAGRSVDLQCNAGSPDCKTLKAGTYIVIKLPKNHGMYDCQNADVFEQAANPDSDERIGEYCLYEK